MLQPDPLQLSLVFDDRYFMASNELNLLDTPLADGGGDDDESRS